MRKALEEQKARAQVGYANVYDSSSVGSSGANKELSDSSGIFSFAQVVVSTDSTVTHQSNVK